jgi:hypothetical protein
LGRYRRARAIMKATGYWLKAGKEKCLRHPEATPDIA